MQKLSACTLFLLCASAVADTLNMGLPFATPGVAGDLNLNPAGAQTDIDLGNPAPAAGQINTVHFRWAASGCANGVKIKFFRRSGNTLSVIAERGPFTTAADNNVTLSPPVAVLQGDLIAITRLGTCGNAETFATPAAFIPYVAFPSDVTGSVALSSGTPVDGFSLALSGTGTTTTTGEILRAVIPVVGTTAGLNASNFKTTMQVHPASGFGFVARLVFRRQGVAGSPSDPSKTISVTGGETVDLGDIVSAMGQTGLGSIDVVAGTTMQMPAFTVRVFNDAGAAGTSGFIEDVVKTPETSPRVMGPGAVAFLITPADLTRSRLNIGIRTLSSGATITVAVQGENATVLRTVTKEFVADFFQQTDAATFTGGAIAANQSIQISVTAGTIIVYGATTDNTTNDPAIQFAEPLY